MKIEPIKKFLKSERLVWTLVVGAFVLHLFSWAYLILNIRPGDQLLILHYTVHFGVDYLSTWTRAYFVPVIGLIFFAINFALAFWYYARIRVLSYLLLITNVVVQAVLFAVSILIVFLNT